MVALPSLCELRLHSAPTAAILDDFGQVEEGGTDGYAEVLKRLVNAAEHKTLRELAEAYHQALQHVAAVSRKATDTNVFKTIAAHLEIPTAFATGSDRKQDFPEAWNGPNAPPEDAVVNPQVAAKIQRRSLFLWLSWMTRVDGFLQLGVALEAARLAAEAAAEAEAEATRLAAEVVAEEAASERALRAAARVAAKAKAARLAAETARLAAEQGLDMALWIASVVRPGDELAVLMKVLRHGQEVHFDSFVQRMEHATQGTWKFADEKVMPLVHLVEVGAHCGMSAFQVAIRAVRNRPDVLLPTDEVSHRIVRWRDFATNAALQGHADVVLFCFHRLQLSILHLVGFWPDPLQALVNNNHYDGVIAVVNGAVSGLDRVYDWKVKCAMLSSAVSDLDSDIEIFRLMEAAYTPAQDAPVDSPFMPTATVEETVRGILERAGPPGPPLEGGEAFQPLLGVLIGRGRAFLTGLSVRHDLVQALPSGDRLLELVMNPFGGLGRSVWCFTLAYTLGVLGNQVPVALARLNEAMRFVLGKALYKPFQRRRRYAPSNGAVIACFVQLRSLYELNRTASNPGRAVQDLVNVLFSDFFFELARLIEAIDLDDLPEETRDGAIRRICPPDLLAGLVNAYLDDATPSPHAPLVDTWHTAVGFRNLFSRPVAAVQSKLGQSSDPGSLQILREYDSTFQALSARLTVLDTTGLSANSGY
jgi:hypothetical protein